MASANAGAIRPATRPIELQDPFNRFLYHPLSARLARALRPTGISPNAVSVGSLILLCVAAWGYTGLAYPLSVFTGFGAMLVWHVVDGADGDLARMTGRASATGELVDGVCDYLGNVILYFAFAFLLDDTLGAWAWILAVAAGASHILQTNHAETQRRLYLWRAYGVPWLRNAAATGDAVFRRDSWFTRYFGFWAIGYVWLSNRMSPSANPIDAALGRAEGDPKEAKRIRLMVRRASRASLILEKSLGANPKTFVIAASMAIGSPLWFFLAMIFGLNLVLLVSIVHHNRVARRLAAAISA